MRKIIDKTNNSKCRDPLIIKHNGKFYHCFTEDQKTVSVACADSVEEFQNAKAKVVFVPEENKEYSKEIWAPELHIIDGKCYIYVACDNGQNCNHKMFVLSNDSSDPMKAEYKMLGKITDDTNRWAIDGTVLTHKDKMYFVWSGWEEEVNICQHLYIAEMSDPVTISSERVMISSPEYPWEKLGSEGVINSPYINEGPFAVYNGDDTYITYSASASWCEDYCIAAIKLVGEDLLNKNSWQKQPLPLLSSNESLKGAGHCSVLEENGKYKVYFHAWDKAEENITWNTVSLWEGELKFSEGELLIK